jgi:mono/diheme cytochrome c family protein
MTRRFRVALFVGVCLVCLASRMSATARLRADVPRSPLTKAPSAAQSWQNPYDAQTDAILAGGKLFRYHCTECHGANASGSQHAPSLRSSLIRDTPPGVLFWFLTNGNLRHGMPSWSRLPDERRWQIVSYLKSINQ